MCCRDFGHIYGQCFGNLARDDIVDLAHMTDRILSSNCLEAHRAAGRYQAICSIAAAHLTIIPRLRRRTRNGKIKGAGGGIICRVDLDSDGSEAVMGGKLLHKFFDGSLFGEIVIKTRHVTPHNGTRDCNVYRPPVSHSHDLHVLAPGRMLMVTVSSIDPLLDREYHLLKRAHRRIANTN
ncbi:MAG: hypothetical protein BGO93_11325 [Mesorhizobium sp. 65-26]|nr:MAG: hypothetical protein BGO93_11325 [Mesorhizobium sp. 65-26]